MAQITLFQFDPQIRTIPENIDYICRRLKSINKSLIILPEFFLSSYITYECIPSKELASVLAPLFSLATTNELAFVGSLPVKTRGASYNRGVFISSRQLQTKDKAKLFGQERDKFSLGKSNPIFTYENISFSLQICLDIINPIPTHVAVRRGAKLIVNPSTVSVDYLKTINKARALENGITTIFCNRSGTEENGIHYLGGSSVYFADGTEKTIRASEGLLSFNL